MRFYEWCVLMDAVPENPRADHDLVAHYDARFRVVVPVTGGMDSSALWKMAEEAGVPAEPVYVDGGQEYAEAERRAVYNVLGVAPVVLTAQFSPDRWQHIIPRRNLTIAVEVADYMRRRDWWGEIWFGNLAGETPAARGDKSSAFFVGLAEHMVKDGPAQDVQVVQPLRALDKTDLVRWWRSHGYGATEYLLGTKSCFHPTLRACGECQTCFRKAVAFLAAGLPALLVLRSFANWQPDQHIAKYKPLMTDALAREDWRRYSPARCRDTLLAIDIMEAW